MAIRIKPRTFGPIKVRLSSDGDVQFFDQADGFGAVPPVGTPVDTLLASLGACIAKSLVIVADQRQHALSPFSVEITGEKATDLPSRLGVINIKVTGPLTDTQETSANLVKQAKSICTVSNTLNCAITLTYEDDAH